VQYRDALIGLPQSMSGVVLFRNKGIIPEAAATYEDMVVAANAATSGEVSGANLEYGSLFAAPNLISVCGGEWMDAEGEPAFNTDAGVCWIEIFKQWRLDFDQVANYSDADVDQFKAGRLGYLIESSLRINALAEAIGADQLVIDPWPKYSDGQLSGYVITDNIYLSVNASGEDKAASLAFIEFLLSPEAQIILADPTRAAHLPVNKDVLVDEPLLTQALIALEQGVSLSGFPEMHAYWPPLNDALLRAVLEDADPAEVLEEAYNRVTDDLVKMRGE
jgi:ABC-type glycerol-3-phosphate transport system substrate-binding protein